MNVIPASFLGSFKRYVFKAQTVVVLISFLFNNLTIVHAQSTYYLPAPGVRVGLSPEFTPAILKGVKVDPKNPLQFEFLIDSGDSNLQGDELKRESEKLIRYFLASITVPENDLWVNLSPYEKDRVIPEAFGQTEMGRDLLAQDYLLKQITASLLYPEQDMGKRFWEKVYAEAYARFGTTEIPVNTFNKVWIVPEKAVIFEEGNMVFIEQSRLKVMLDEDYVALSHQKDSAESSTPAGDVALSHQKDSAESSTPVGDVALSESQKVRKSEGQKDRKSESQNYDEQMTERSTQNDKSESSFVNRETVSQTFHVSQATNDAKDINKLGSEIIRSIVIPELEREVNEGKNFARLRQVYHALILATWYKQKIKDSILAKIYVDQNKTAGVDLSYAEGKESEVRGLKSGQNKGQKVIRSEGQNYDEQNAELSTQNDKSETSFVKREMQPESQRNTNHDSPMTMTSSNTARTSPDAILTVEEIYAKYVEAFKTGVYNYIKEDYDPATQDVVPRKYFSGGVRLRMNMNTALGNSVLTKGDGANLAVKKSYWAWAQVTPVSKQAWDDETVVIDKAMMSEFITIPPWEVWIGLGAAGLAAGAGWVFRIKQLRNNELERAWREGTKGVANSEFINQPMVKKRIIRALGQFQTGLRYIFAIAELINEDNLEQMVNVLVNLLRVAGEEKGLVARELSAVKRILTAENLEQVGNGLIKIIELTRRHRNSGRVLSVIQGILTKENAVEVLEKLVRIFELAGKNNNSVAQVQKVVQGILTEESLERIGNKSINIIQTEEVISDALMIGLEFVQGILTEENLERIGNKLIDIIQTEGVTTQSLILALRAVQGILTKENAEEMLDDLFKIFELAGRNNYIVAHALKVVEGILTEENLERIGNKLIDFIQKEGLASYSLMIQLNDALENLTKENAEEMLEKLFRIFELAGSKYYYVVLGLKALQGILTEENIEPIGNTLIKMVQGVERENAERVAKVFQAVQGILTKENAGEMLEKLFRIFELAGKENESVAKALEAVQGILNEENAGVMLEKLFRIFELAGKDKDSVGQGLIAVQGILTEENLERIGNTLIKIVQGVEGEKSEAIMTGLQVVRHIITLENFEAVASNLAITMRELDSGWFISVLSTYQNDIKSPEDLDPNREGSVVERILLFNAVQNYEQAQRIWNQAQAILARGEISDEISIVRRGLMAASVLFGNDRIVPFITQHVLNEQSPWLSSGYENVVAAAIYTLGTLTNDARYIPVIRQLIVRQGLQGHNYAIEGLRRLEASQMMEGSQSRWVEHLVDRIIENYSDEESSNRLQDILGEEQGLAISDYIQRDIKGQLNQPSGKAPFVPVMNGDVRMGFYRSVDFGAFKNYLIEGHDRKKSGYHEETYIGVTLAKIMNYGRNSPFIVWMPAESYNKRARVKGKLKLGHRSQYGEELVLNDDITPEEMRIFFVDAEKLQANSSELNSVLASQNIAILKQTPEGFEYLQEDIQGASEFISDAEEAHPRLREIINQHKQIGFRRLIVSVSVPEGESFKSAIKELLQKHPVFAQEFQDSDHKRMVQESLRGYLKMYLIENPQVYRAYSRINNKNMQGKVKWIANQTRGSQKGADLEIDGRRYYAKFYENEDRMRAELLSWMIFREVGLPVVEDMRIVEVNGRKAIASLWYDQATEVQRPMSEQELALEYVAGSFVQDRDRGKADNYLQVDDQIVPIDFGGSAMFRSRGGIKGADEEIHQLPFGLSNFLSMLSVDGMHRSKALYGPLKGREDLIRQAIIRFIQGMDHKSLAAFIEAVEFQDPEIKGQIQNVYFSTLRELQNRAVDELGVRRDLDQISPQVNAVRQIVGHRLVKAEEVWQAVTTRIDKVEALQRLMRLPSGRSSWDAQGKVDLRTHTRDVFVGLNLEGVEERVNWGEYSVRPLLRMAALFHDLGKFVDGETGEVDDIIRLIDFSTQKSRLPQDWENFTEAIDAWRNNPGNLSIHEEISKALLVLFMPLLGFNNRVEIELAREILDKDKIGMMSESSRYGVMRHLTLEDIDQEMFLPQMLISQFSQRGRWGLTKDILELSKALYIADVQISRGIRNEVLQQDAAGKWDIRLGAIPKWDDYEQHVRLEAEREKALTDYLRQGEGSSEGVDPLLLKRRVGMIAMDFDDTFSRPGEDVQQGLLDQFVANLEAGIKIVFISGTSVERIKRKINYDQLSERAKSHLMIIGRYGFERLTPSGQSAAAPMSEEIRQKILEQINAIFPGKVIPQNSRSHLRMKINEQEIVDITAFLNEFKNKINLRNHKFFVSRENVLHIIPKDKGDLLREVVSWFGINPQELVVIGDETGNFASDQSLFDAYAGDALLVNVGELKESKSSKLLALVRRYDGGTRLIFDTIDSSGILQLSDIFSRLSGVALKTGKVRKAKKEKNVLLDPEEEDLVVADKAMIAEKLLDTRAVKVSPASTTQDEDSLGGIDLTKDRMGLQIRQNVESVEFKFDPAIFENMPIDGFSVEVLKITPLNNPRLFMGDKDRLSQEQQLSMVR